MKNFKLKISILQFLFFSISSYSFAGDLLWTVKRDNDVKWMAQADSALIIFATKQGLYAIDSWAGTYLWEKVNLSEITSEQVEFIFPQKIMIIYQNNKEDKSTNIFAINIKDGKEIWKAEPITGSPVGVYYNDGEGEILYFFTKKGKSETVGESKGDFFFNTLPWAMYKIKKEQKFETSLYIIDINTGKIRVIKEPFSNDNIKVPWDLVSYLPPLRRAVQLDNLRDSWTSISPSILPLPTTKHTLLFYQKPIFDNNKKAYFAFPIPCQVDLHTGNILWWCQDNKLKKTAISLSIGQMIDDDSTIFIPNDNKLCAVNKMDGRIKWISKKNKRKIGWLGMDRDNIYITGQDYINAISKSNGNFLWKKPFKFSGLPCVPLFQENKIYLFASTELLCLDKDNGKLVYKNGLKGYKDFFLVGSLLLNDSSLVYVNAQSICLFDPTNGKLKLHKQFEPVSVSGVTTLIGTLSGHPEVLDMAYCSTIMTNRYVYILTYLKEKIGLIIADINNGTIKSEIVLNDRKPNYLVDDTHSMIFQYKGKEIKGFKY